MKVTYQWLREYVDFPWSPDELSNRLTMLGVEVEGVQKISGEFESIVVAQILASDKHPNADKLSVCRVAEGQGERQIVCGAKNYQVGDKVPLALPGCAMPVAPGTPPFVIKASKMRGVESQGMLCSASELGLAADAEGLLILPADAKVGQPLAEHLGRSAGDVVYDLEITPNRPDLNSVIGLAREIAALTGNKLKWPSIAEAAPSTESAKSAVDVRIDNPGLCPRYIARVVKGATIKPSPNWLKSTLEKVGIRSINNVVDITNFVLMETGQPLHAFDYHLIGRVNGAPPTIVIRTAQPGEKITTLDGKERELDPSMLLIADEKKGLALAGIMGGANSEINDRTQDILIESAAFSARNIRATSKKLEIRSEASYRFERGCDVEICEWASRRAAQLMAELAGATILTGAVEAYPQPPEPKTINLRFAKTDQLLGITISPQEQLVFLRGLELNVVSQNDTSAEMRVPSFRLDLKAEIDLVEEITRVYGVDRIPSSAPRGTVGSNPFDAIYDQLMVVRRIFAGQGLSEAQGQTLVTAESAKLAVDAPELVVNLANPLSSDMSVLRPSLLPGLIDSLRHNLSHKNGELALFEVGRVFQQSPAGTTEERRVAIALTGMRQKPFWSGSDRDARWDIYDLKGILEEFFETFGLRGIVFTRRTAPTGLFIESATITLGKQTIGQIGQLLPTLGRQNDLRDPAYLAELNLDLLMARRQASRSFKQLAQFPAIRRDVAMLVSESLTNDSVLTAIKQAKPANLESVQLFDVFRGKNIPEGQKSVAYAFTYRSAEKTLTDQEVNTAHEKVVQQFKTQLQATVRDT